MLAVTASRARRTVLQRAVAGVALTATVLACSGPHHTADVVLLERPFQREVGRDGRVQVTSLRRDGQQVELGLQRTWVCTRASGRESVIEHRDTENASPLGMAASLILLATGGTLSTAALAGLVLDCPNSAESGLCGAVSLLSLGLGAAIFGGGMLAASYTQWTSATTKTWSVVPHEGVLRDQVACGSDNASGSRASLRWYGSLRRNARVDAAGRATFALNAPDSEQLLPNVAELLLDDKPSLLVDLGRPFTATEGVAP